MSNRGGVLQRTLSLPHHGVVRVSCFIDEDRKECNVREKTFAALEKAVRRGHEEAIEIDYIYQRLKVILIECEQMAKALLDLAGIAGGAILCDFRFDGQAGLFQAINCIIKQFTCLTQRCGCLPL